MSTPHHYVVTKPYNGCGQCGYGPGALVHNTYEVLRVQDDAVKLDLERAFQGIGEAVYDALPNIYDDPKWLDNARRDLLTTRKRLREAEKILETAVAARWTS